MPKLSISYQGEFSKLARALPAMAPAIGWSMPESMKEEVAGFCDRQIENLNYFPNLVDVTVACINGRVCITCNWPGQIIIDLHRRTVELVHPNRSRIAVIECSLSAC